MLDATASRATADMVANEEILKADVGLVAGGDGSSEVRASCCGLAILSRQSFTELKV